MKKLSVILSLITLIALTSACSQSETPSEAAPAQQKQPAPEFVKQDDPKAFVADYLTALQRETLFPKALVEELDGSTHLKGAYTMIDNHHTMQLLQWFYSADYLAKVREIVDQKVARMDYQLKILEVDPAMATDVQMLVDSGPFLHAKMLQQGELTQKWRQTDENTYNLGLVQGDWQQLLRVVKVDGVWKLEVVGY